MTLRWDCEKRHECYLKQLPKWGCIEDCFPGKIAPTDVDGMVEINGNFLFLEWKRPNVILTTGQRIMFERLTATCPASVFLINGDPLTTTPSKLQIFRDGRVVFDEKCDLETLRSFCSRWAYWAKTGRKAA